MLHWQHALRQALERPDEQSTCRHIVVGSVFVRPLQDEMIEEACMMMVYAGASGTPRSFEQVNLLFDTRHYIIALTMEAVTAHLPNLRAPCRNAMCCN